MSVGEVPKERDEWSNKLALRRGDVGLQEQFLRFVGRRDDVFRGVDEAVDGELSEERWPWEELGRHGKGELFERMGEQDDDNASAAKLDDFKECTKTTEGEVFNHMGM